MASAGESIPIAAAAASMAATGSSLRARYSATSCLACGVRAVQYRPHDVSEPQRAVR
jgi:hypothetical protein